MQYWKSALQKYINGPGNFEETVFWDDKAVIIRDVFPKAQFHLLILPRDPHLTRKPPAIALNDYEKLHLIPYVIKAQNYIFQQFTAKFVLLHGNSFFKDEREFMDKNLFVQKFVQVGIHSIPSMDNLHIHLITKDFYSTKLKNKKHYLSFNSDFFIHWYQLPLAQMPNAKAQEELLGNSDMICTYCGVNFKNRMKALKEHLKVEFTTNFVERSISL